MNSSPFTSPERFRDLFSSALAEMLQDYAELGIYILVLANATMDGALWTQLSPQLANKFEQLNRAEGKRLLVDDVVDDRVVFHQLEALGFASLTPVRFRQLDPWELQYNPLRSLRPPRLMKAQMDGLSVPFNPSGFHFAKPFLRKEIFWQGPLCGRHVSLFYNKFPFIERMGMLVPEVQEARPQYLQQADHAYAWQVMQSLAEKLPGIGMGYNSLGAFASVNHLHFHLFQRQRPLPVVSDLWCHNGGDIPYPVECLCFDSPARAWELIREWHGTQTPYSLLYMPGRLYCLSRKPQAKTRVAPWSGGVGWYEMAGGFSVVDEAAFNRLVAGDVEAAMIAAGNPS
jgi:diadenosine tetraphosphate (Ap4A) HIT family hydrolase